MNQGIGYLFIAGASRSGTTLLMNLLDGHPDLVVFPLEHKTFPNYFLRKRSERPVFFRDSFVRMRSNGQQSILADRQLMIAYQERMRGQHGMDFSFEIDPDAFLREYLNSLDYHPISLRTVLDSLVSGLATANSYANSIIDSARFAVLKDPFTTEFFARQIAAEIPEARFLHIIRNPLDRYCSIKRILGRKQKFLGRTYLRRVEFEPFVTGFAEQAVASLHTGKKNQEELGEDRYRILRFEDVVGNPRKTLGTLTDWLGIRFEESLLRPSKLGRPVSSGSSFESASEIDNGAMSRHERHFRKMTSPSERDLYYRYLQLSDYSRHYDLPEPSEPQSLRLWLQPFKGERIRDYLWRIASGKARVALGDTELESRLQERLVAVYHSRI